MTDDQQAREKAAKTHLREFISAGSLDIDVWSSFLDGWQAAHNGPAVKALSKMLDQKMHLIGKMNAALIERGVNFDFDEALKDWKGSPDVE